MNNIKFGWIPAPSSKDHSDGELFLKQIINIITDIQNDFDSVWISDHFIAPSSYPSTAHPRLEALTTLTYLAHAFPNLDFGNMVLAQSYRNPALLAKMGATIQLLTGGRFILGIGAGWLEEEYHAYDYEFPKASVRIHQLEEAVQIIRQLWTETPATFIGDHYQIKNALCEPKPNPVPPVMIGGNGEKYLLRAVASQADWWNAMNTTADTLAHKMEVLRSHCQAVGRNYDDIGKTFTGIIAIAETEAKAKQIADASPHNPGIHLVGTSEQIAEYVKPYIDLGVEYFMSFFADFPNSAGAIQFAKEVIPALREKSSLQA